jgi:hypothetical protein
MFISPILIFILRKGLNEDKMQEEFLKWGDMHIYKEGGENVKEGINISIYTKEGIK